MFTMNDNQTTNTLIFIDKGVQDYQNLMDGAQAGTKVVLLDTSKDGVQQIAEALASYNNLESIQLFSHGNSGQLALGSTILDASSIDNYQEQLTIWGESLSETGDILLYGCNVAQGIKGQTFIQQLSEKTHADIAASTDITGSALLDGDWVLEANAGGTIETNVALETATLSAYSSALLVANEDYEDDVAVSDPVPSNTTWDNDGWTYTSNDVGATTSIYVRTTLDFTGNSLQAVSSGAGAMTELSVKSTDGSEFKLMSFDYGRGYSSNLNGVVITGYRDNIAVSGASIAIADGLLTYHIDVNADTNWQNIDEIRITGPDLDPEIDNLFVTAPVLTPTPAITAATYDASTHILTVTGTAFEAKSGASNDVNVANLTLSGEGGASYTLSSADVEITNATTFSITLNATDQINVAGLLNKNGSSAVDATSYNLAASDDFIANVTAGDTSDLTGNAITVSNVQTPSISSSSYNATTGALVVTGTNFVKASGANNDISANKFTFLGEGGATYSLTDTANVEISSATEFSLILSTTDKSAINQIINKNGTASTGAMTYNLSAADDWNTVIANTDISDVSNGITASNVATPVVNSATYNANSGSLVVTGTGFLNISGANNDIDVSKLTFTGEANETYTLTDSADIEISSGTAFTVTLSATDKAAINQIMNKNGLTSNDVTTYNLAAAEDWARGADPSVAVVDATGNSITVNNVAIPVINTATYDAATGILVVTGNNYLKSSGPANDIDVSMLTFTGEGGTTYNLTDSSDVDILSATSFSVLLSATDKAAVNQIINKDGSSSTNATLYNLGAAEDWAMGADSAVVVVDATGNAITASNVAIPIINSASYDYNTNTLVVTGTGFLNAAGAANDIDVSKLTFTGESGASYALSSTTDVEITSGTQFNLLLSGTDLTHVESLLNKNGTASESGTTYNLAAAEDWAVGADGAINVADVSANNIVVSNYSAPTISSSIYDVSTGQTLVIGTNFVSNSGVANDVDASLFSFTGEGGATYSLTDTLDVDISSDTTFILTLSATDQLTINGLLNKNGVVSADASTYNLAATEDWMIGSAAAINVADTIANPITTSNVVIPTISSSIYDSATGVLDVTASDLFKKIGAVNDIDISKFTFTGGVANQTYTLTSNSDIEITSDSSFSLTLTGLDKTQVDNILDQIGTTSSAGSTYNLSLADNWLTAADSTSNISDTTNSITVNIAPTIVSATYDASSGVLIVTGTNIQANGSAFDIDASRVTLTGEGGNTYTLTDSNDVNRDSVSQFTLLLSAADQAGLKQMMNKNGSSSTGGTNYNIAVADDWDTNVTSGDTSDTLANAVTVSNVAIPAISGATYDANTGTLIVTGTNFLIAAGANNDIDVSKLSLTGEGGAVYTLSDSSDVDTSNANSFTVILSATDQAEVNQMMNKNGTSSTDATSYNLAAMEDWALGAASAVVTVDATANAITTSNVAAPTIIDATYNSASGVLVVTGTGYLKASGAANDIDISKLTFTGGVADATYTLSSATDIEITSGTSFTLTLSGADKSQVDLLLDQSGTVSNSGSTYNLSAAEDWAVGADSAVNVIDNTNAITVTATPQINSATYDADSGILVVTGSNIQANGSGLDIDASTLSLTGEGGEAYTLTNTSDVNRDSNTQFTVLLSNEDKVALNQIMNNDGVNSSSGATYNIAVADDWNTSVTAGNISDTIANAVTVSNVAIPIITGTAYNTTSGILTVSGTGFLNLNGVNNDIDVSLFTFTGEGGGNYSLTDTIDVDITSGTKFTLILSNTDKFEVNQLLNNIGTSAADTTPYNLAAAEDWAKGANASVNVIDLSSPITVIPIPITPTPPASEPPILEPDSDGDGADNSVEDQVPDLDGTATGDGNGDGQADAQQENVASLVSSGAAHDYITFAIDAELNPSANFSQVQVYTDDTNTPDNLELPLGLFEFTIHDIAIGEQVAISAYIPDDMQINGYWKQDNNGFWHDIATHISMVGNKTKIDFTLTDGGIFDRDGLANGEIIDPSGPALFSVIENPPQNNLDTDNDGRPDLIETSEGFDLNIKDNNIFTENNTFIKQVSRELLNREISDTGLQSWSNLLDTSILNKGQVVKAFFDSNEFQQGAGTIYGLYHGLFNRSAGHGGINAWLDLYHDGASLNSIAESFYNAPESNNRFSGLDNESFIQSLYTRIFNGNTIAQDELIFWKNNLDNGGGRGNIAVSFVQSEQFQLDNQARVMTDTLFLQWLDRDPGAEGYQYWVQSLSNPQSPQYTQQLDSFFTHDEVEVRFIGVVDSLVDNGV